MTSLVLNPEFARRYALVALLFAGMGCWFGYDGLVKYPKADPAALYVAIEKSEPREGTDLEAFRRQKIRSQLGMAAALLVAAGWVGAVLLRARRLSFAYDAAGFVHGGLRTAYSEVTAVDRSRWESKGILALTAGSRRIVLDGWHHRDVRAFEKVLASALGGADAAGAAS